MMYGILFAPAIFLRERWESNTQTALEVGNKYEWLYWNEGGPATGRTYRSNEDYCH